MPTKIVLTNGSAIDGKYGNAAHDVWDALDRLVAADAARGLQTSVARIDEHGVADPQDASQAKAAIDALLTPAPDYALLLGGPDVIPHVALTNPTGDEDSPTLPSDLPYACDVPMGSEIHHFIAPTRVLSRLPDMPGASDPGALVSALGTATTWTQREAAQYAPPLAISAEVWQASTALTVTQLFGASGVVRTSPDDGPGWTAGELSCLTHFVNCHGAPGTPTYYGQRQQSYPPAHEAGVVDGALSDGTVLAAECCYGAQLYEPPDGRRGMPFAYLGSGAYAVFGSTTIAYGPADANLYADVICRLFVAAVLGGASVGRAGLEARQNYIARSSPLDPVEQKTVGQFLVLGDPSITPVAAAKSPAAFSAASKDVRGVAVPRSELAAKGLRIGGTSAYAAPTEEAPSDEVVEALCALVGVEGAGRQRVSSFVVRGGVQSKGMFTMAGLPEPPAIMHMLMQTIESPEAPIPQHVVVVATEQGGRLTSVRTALSR